jgi:hypothetical protein
MKDSPLWRVYHKIALAVMPKRRQKTGNWIDILAAAAAAANAVHWQ